MSRRGSRRCSTRQPEQLLARLLDDSDRSRRAHRLPASSSSTGREIEKLACRASCSPARPKRYYPEGDIASALLGFLGRDHVGLAGLEADLDDVLGGTPGAHLLRARRRRPADRLRRSRVEPGRPGADVRLTIDRYIQRLVENELDFQIKDHQASGGTIIVMDPKTGAILAMASRPSFKLSSLRWTTGNLDLYRNRAVTDLYEPGSVLKTITMATAIDLGLVNPNTTYFDAGTVEKGGYTFKNWDFSANGMQTMTQLLQKSLNTGAIWLSDLIGATKLYDSLKRFGFGESTHSGLGGEADGLVAHEQGPRLVLRPTSRPTATARASPRRRCR